MNTVQLIIHVSVYCVLLAKSLHIFPNNLNFVYDRFCMRGHRALLFKNMGRNLGKINDDVVDI